MSSGVLSIAAPITDLSMGSLFGTAPLSTTDGVGLVLLRRQRLHMRGDGGGGAAARNRRKREVPRRHSGRERAPRVSAFTVRSTRSDERGWPRATTSQLGIWR